MKDWTKREAHLIYHQILIYKDILNHQRKKLEHLRTRWRLEIKNKLLPDVDYCFEAELNAIDNQIEILNKSIQKYFINFFETQKLSQVISNDGLTPNKIFGIKAWMSNGENYGVENNKILKEILGDDYPIKDFNPLKVNPKKQNFAFNSTQIIEHLRNFVEDMYRTISLIEHCFDQRVQGSQIPVLETRVTDVEKIGGTQFMYYAADSLVLDYCNIKNFDFEKMEVNKLWSGVTNFGYYHDFGIRGSIIVAPGWSKYIHPESWFLFSHECGHLIIGRYLLHDYLLYDQGNNEDFNTFTLVNEISKTISPLFRIEDNITTENILSDMYAIFMAGPDFLSPLMNLHFSPFTEYNVIPLRIDICKLAINYLGLDKKFIDNRLSLLNSTEQLMANFELVKQYRENMFLLDRSLKNIKIANEEYCNSALSLKDIKAYINDGLLRDSRLEFSEIAKEIIGLDYYKDIAEDFRRREIVEATKKLIPFGFYESLMIYNSQSDEIYEVDNNFKEIVLALMSYDLEKEEIPYKNATMLCNEEYILSPTLLYDFFEEWDNTENFRFAYLEPLLNNTYKKILFEILEDNMGIPLQIKPRHLISLITRNEKINLNSILFALSHNRNIRLRYRSQV